MLGRILNKTKTACAFSLVELMISLIVVSLISAAFAPVITKKLSSLGVTVGSFANGGNGASDGDENFDLKKQLCNLQNKYWDTTSKKCLQCEIDGCGKCVESGPYGCDECSDSGFVFVDGACVGDPCSRYGAVTVGNLCVTKRNIGDDDKYYPTIPNTKGSCKTGITTSNTCNSDGGDYSGCKRSVCTRDAALTACWNLEVNGLKGWHLPYAEEIKDLDKVESQICTNIQKDKTTQCSSASGTWPYALWINSSTCASNAYYTYAYHKGSWSYICSFADGGANPSNYNSVRCAINRCRAIDNHCQECDSNKCTKCDYDYEVNQYGKCTKCAEGYSYSEVSKKCIKDPCEKYEAVAVGNICVSKKNYGDSTYYNYQAPSAGSCSQQVSFTNYTRDNGDYSGSPRTLCNRTGALNVCGRLNVKGLTGWRLPMLGEMSHWNENSLARGNGGLMLCSSNQINGVSWCPKTSDYQPYAMWSGTNNTCTSDAYYTYSYYNSSWSQLCSYADGGASPSSYNSVRCVIDKCKALDKHCVSCDNEKCSVCEKDYYPDKNGACVKCPENQLFNQNTGKCEVDTCLKYDAVTVGKTCVLKRNYGDSALYSYSAPTSGECLHNYKSNSWSDSNGSYSGESRTVCNRSAALVACINLEVNGLSGWRLPNSSEQADWAKNTINYGDGGLMLCSKSSGGVGISHCSGTDKAAPSALWSTSGNTCQSGAYYNYAFVEEYSNICSYADGGASPSSYNSVRCVIDKCRSIEHCVECSENTCTKCERNYYPNGGKCTLCPDGQLYNSVSKKCETDKCLKYDAININGLCVQRKNYGDSTYYSYKTPTSGTCCVGMSSLGGNKNGSYRAEKRTLCNREGAISACQNLEIRGLSGWHLPTLDEMSSWGAYTANFGDGGLMLCSQKQLEGVSYCPKSNAGGNTGYPFALWSSSNSKCESSAYNTYAYNSSYAKICSYADGGANPSSFNSVRCVIEASKLP